ncbi:MAG: histone deacetylase [Caldilineaceae bacterium]|nr:histone deacetylase [Caldilineaceae bacterium]
MSLPLVFHPDYVTPLPPGHRFPMPKFGKVYEYLIKDGLAALEQFHVPQVAPVEWLTLAHTPAYVQAYTNGDLDARAMRRIGLPWSPELVNRTCTAVGGTVLTAQLALQHGMACNTAGGTHHAHADFGSGFCIFNDLAVTALYMLAQSVVQRVLIVDLDVHQGDGTASILRDHANAFTFSMHCGKNFPYRKSASDLDVELPVDMADDAYLQTLHRHLPSLLDEWRPDLVLYDGGVDPHREDRLGLLALTDAGLYTRDKWVFSQCVGRGIPVACVIGGGYDVDVDRLARRHCLMHRAAQEVLEQSNSLAG